MRTARTRLLSIIACLVMAACAAQPAAESEAPTVTDSGGEASAAPSPTPGPSDESTPSPSAEPLAACDLILAESDAPDGATAGEPRLDTLDDLRARAAETAEGSPGRAAAEANLAAYESMGLVERCVRSFNVTATGTTFASAALTFEDESGPPAYVDFLMEGCEAAELPAAATVDATAIVCSASFPPLAFVVVTDGTMAQSVSAQGLPGGSFDQAAILDQALALIDALPER